MLQKYFARWGDKMFEEEMASIVKKHAAIAALIMMLPLFGLGVFAFAAILWHMYYDLCEKCGTKLKLSSVILGILVNVVVAFVINLLFSFIPVLGWLGTGFLIYVQFYFSGKSYIEILRKLNL